MEMTKRMVPSSTGNVEIYFTNQNMGAVLFNDFEYGGNLYKGAVNIFRNYLWSPKSADAAIMNQQTFEGADRETIKGILSIIDSSVARFIVDNPNVLVEAEINYIDGQIARAEEERNNLRRKTLDKEDEIETLRIKRNSLDSDQS